MLKRRKYILMALTAFLALFLFWAVKEEVHAMLIAPPEVCALCDQEPQNTPCLLNISTGEVGKLVGTTLPGKFQVIGLPGAWGGWDSDTQTGRVTLPQEPPQFLVPLFCRSCRWTILGNAPANYYLADLSAPQKPLLCPIGDAPLTILGWTICPEPSPEGTTLTISPAA